MRSFTPEPHERILIVDDDEAIHGDYQKLLGPEDAGTEALDDFEAALFGAPLRRAPRWTFTLDHATQGEEGVRMVRCAVDEQRPYAVTFVDVRMPPGIDGVETASRMLDQDPHLHVVLCTAYTDHDHVAILDRLGDRTDRLLFLRKPYDAVELRQCAIAMTSKWRLESASREQMRSIEAAVQARTRDLDSAITMLRGEIASRVRIEDEHQQLERFHTLGKLTAVLAHEVSRPLAVVGSCVDMLGRRLPALLGTAPEPEAEAALADLAEAHDAVARIAKIMDHIGIFAEAPGSDAHRTIDLRDPLRDALALVAHPVRRCAELVVRLGPPVGVRADRRRLHQVFVHLLVNATQAMSQSKHAANHLSVAIGPLRDRKVRVTITDTGEGIAPGILARCFDPFFTTRPDAEGSGLGLSICKRVVEDHGGSIEITSKPGRGTTVTVTLPGMPLPNAP